MSVRSWNLLRPSIAVGNSVCDLCVVIVEIIRVYTLYHTEKLLGNLFSDAIVNYLSEKVAMKISDCEGSYMEAYEADYTNGEDVFADVQNLDHCIKYLNQSLVTFGFPSGLNLYSSDPVSIAKTCNCIYAMIQQRQRDIEYRETANDTRQRLISDMSRLETKMERVSDQLSIKEREMQMMASKEQKLTAGFKTQLEKLQLEKDEFQRMLIATQQVRSQQNHELKKKEKEYVKLQERLNQVVIEKKKESKNGIEVMNLLQKEGRQRGTWNAKKADGDFYKMIVDAYESKKQELVAENADLRASLRSMQTDMRNFLNTSSDSSRPGNISNGSVDLEPPPTPLGGRTDVFDLPFHMARDQIEQSLRAKMFSIKERMMQLQEGQKGGQVGDSNARELQLEEQLAEARSIMDEQATLMTKHIPDPEENSDIPKEPELSEEPKVVTPEENTIVRVQKEDVAVSRDFSRDRNELSKAQQILVDEQASWTSAVTSMTPAVRGHSGQGGLCEPPPRFENYEEFEQWIARSAFGGRHDETMVMLQRTQTVAIGPAVSNNESRFSEIA